MASGIVKFYKDEKGWGAVTIEELPEGHDVFVHYSAIEAEGYRRLTAGDLVELEYEAAEQDSFHYVATSVRLLGPGPAPTLRRDGSRVRVVAPQTPDTPLLPRRG
ncbi:MAG TPA: cold shock domain-containing protein [Propionibacteriaceae bacterium]